MKLPASLFLGLLLLSFSSCGRVPESEAPVTIDAKPVTKGARRGPPPAAARMAVEWLTNDVPTTAAPATTFVIHVKVKNVGNWTWPDKPTANPNKPDGTYAVRLGYRWIRSDGTALPENSDRADLTASVPPDWETNFVLSVMAPPEPNSYQLQLDLVAETVVWFSSKGGEKLTVPVAIQ